MSSTCSLRSGPTVATTSTSPKPTGSPPASAPSSTNPGVTVSDPAGGDETVITTARMDELVDEHFRAEVAGDLQAIADGFAADAEHDLAGRPGSLLRGGDQIRAFYGGLLAELEITRRPRRASDLNA